MPVGNELPSYRTRVLSSLWLQKFSAVTQYKPSHKNA